MDDKVLEILIPGIPVVLAVAAFILGVRQVRLLRQVTGDTSLLTSIFGLTFSKPRPWAMRRKVRSVSTVYVLINILLLRAAWRAWVRRHVAANAPSVDGSRDAPVRHR